MLTGHLGNFTSLPLLYKVILTTLESFDKDHLKILKELRNKIKNYSYFDGSLILSLSNEECLYE